MGEIEHMDRALKRTVRLCQAITRNMDSLIVIKEALALDDTTFASQVFHEIDFKDQRLLMSAPTKGGPFTTQERGIMRGLWEVSAEDMDYVS